MSFKYVKNLLVLALVTNFVQQSIAIQPGMKMAKKGSMNSQGQLPIELKNLPLILDTKNIKIDKYTNQDAVSLSPELLGPGSSGGGNICALNISTATNFIADYADKIPFQDAEQREHFLNTLSSVRFLHGENLEVRGQSVDAINYPAAGVIVINEKVCAQLGAGIGSGYALLVHEYSGVAGIDDRNYQVSGIFKQKVKEEIGSAWCDTMDCDSSLKNTAITAFKKDAQVRKAIAEAMESVGNPQLENVEVITLQNYSASYDDNNESELQVLVVQHYSLLAEHWSSDGVITAKLKVVTKGNRYIVKSVKLETN